MANSDVIASLGTQEATDRARYLVLLRLNSSETADQDELAALAAKYGKSGQQVALDASLVTRFDALKAKVTSGVKATYDTAAHASHIQKVYTTPAAIAALAASQKAAMDALIETEAATQAALDATTGMANAALVAGQNAIDPKNDLFRQNPDLFTGESLSVIADLN